MTTWGWRKHWNSWGWIFAPVLMVLAVPIMIAQVLYVMPVMGIHGFFSSPYEERELGALAVAILFGFFGVVVAVGGISYLAILS